MIEEPEKLKNFVGAFGKTHSGNKFHITKLGILGLKIRYTNEPTDDDVKFVSDLVEQLFNIETTAKNYGEMNKESKEKELNDYNEFMREQRKKE